MRVCARSDCSAPAVAILTYDREAQTAYLFGVDEAETRTPGDLCERHLARLVLPRSWQMDDRRTVVAEAPVAKPAKPRPKKARGPARRKWAEVGPSLFDTPVADVNAVPANEAADASASSEPVWMPRFGPDSDLDDVLDDRTPLLRRAFGNR